MSSRRLDLHASALSDAEYDLYTSSLADITLTEGNDAEEHDDAYYEQLSIGVREVRAWLRGRYSHVPATAIDNILRLFSPNLSQADTLSGGQFFAALRLVVHAESGKEVDRALAFVQAHPSSTPLSRPSSPPKRPAPPAPSRRSTDTTTTTANGSFNPFSTSSTAAPPPVHPSSSSNNPFFNSRSKSNTGTGAPSSTRSHEGALESAPSKLPPLPPRKPPPPIPTSNVLQPPPRHGSLLTSSLLASKSAPVGSSASGFASSPFGTSTQSTPPPPPPPPKTASHVAHVTSTLMKQSLQASKTGQTMKKAEEQLERERILSVLKSSAGSAANSPFAVAAAEEAKKRSSSPSKLGYASSSSSYTSSEGAGHERGRDQAPPLPRRKKPSPPVSTSSFQQVALAGTGFPSSASTSSAATSSTSSTAFSTFPANPFNRGTFRSQSVSESPHESPSSSPSRKYIELSAPPKHPDQNLSPNQGQSQVQGQQSYRKPPPPIPPNLATTMNSSGFNAGAGSGSERNHRRAPSFTNTSYTPLREREGDNESFEMIYGPGIGMGTPGGGVDSIGTKSASPYVSAFSRTPSDTTPTSSMRRLPSTFGDGNGGGGRNGSEESPTARVFRSKSLHHPSPPSSAGRSRFGGAGEEREGGSPFSSVVGRSGDEDLDTQTLRKPPVRRRRPESVQVLMGGGGSGGPGGTISRRMSFTNSGVTNGNGNGIGIGGGQQQQQQQYESPLKTLAASFQPQLQQLQPKFDKALFKAEAGLSRRGFVRGGDHGIGSSKRKEEKEGLMRGGWEDADVLSDGSSDGIGNGSRGRIGVGVGGGGDRWRSRSHGSGRKEVDLDLEDRDQWVGVEKDNLKWPVGEGEGWRPL